MSLLQAQDIAVSYYGDIHVLEGVNIEAAEGRITAVIGPNGAGKSTLLKALYGLLKPSTGSIRFDGRELTGLPVHRFMELGIAYVPQGRSLFPDLTVEENLELGCWSFRRDQQRVRRAIDDLYATFPHLADRQRVRVGTLSGGQQKILEVGRSLLTKPRLLLMDEPTAMLAPLVAKEIYSFLRRQRESQTAVVLVDQNVRQALDVADDVYVLELGRNRAHGTKADFFGRLHEVIQDWLA
ncbi:MAG TPA: ABC transporter ATP-binding protein [bacterium]|nr:ABC transporter ATP-binding protein [bacterium]